MGGLQLGAIIYIKEGEVNGVRYPETGMASSKLARRFFVSGRVQGVGFRWFVQKSAQGIGVDGFTRNLDDGRVEVYATGTAEQLDTLAGLLWKGPRWAEVRHVEQREEPVLEYSGFYIQ
jgi:acylphosphatase